jgi:hypothetical protein
LETGSLGVYIFVRKLQHHQNSCKIHDTISEEFSAL